MPGGRPSLLPSAEGPLQAPHSLPVREKLMMERETNRAEQKNQQVVDSCVRFMTRSHQENSQNEQSLGIPSGTPVRVTELLASECNRAFAVTVDRPLDHYKKCDLILFSKSG